MSQSQATANENNCPNAATAIDTETKEENLLTFGRSLVHRDLQKDLLASTASSEMKSGKGWILAPPLPATQLHCMHLGPAFPPGSASLFKALTLHLPYRLLFYISKLVSHSRGGKKTCYS